MNNTFKSLFLGLCFLIGNETKAQCNIGETALNLDIATDNWGNECYWQITPAGDACGVNTIAEGGNIAQIGCNGAGQQDASNGVGYANNSIIHESPICLVIGESYTLYYMDDYEDGGAHFTLNLFGFPLYQFTGTGANNAFQFTVQEPPLYDVACTEVMCYAYVQPENIEVKGKFFTGGSEVIQTLEMTYTVDGQSPVSAMIEGLTIGPFTIFELTHPTNLNLAEGNHELFIWISSINGNSDMNTANDTAHKSIAVGPGIPNILDNYLDQNTQLEDIAGLAEGVDHPRDLDFHPVLTRNELWVILKSTENTGGKTVKISNAGENDQEELVQIDGNAWHFMSLPTGIAFSRNENFATSPGVYDANHDGGDPFTGPTLWSSDPTIYAQPSGGNGSHIDMLHESPYSMGIAWEKDNKFWVSCGDHNEIMSFDFQHDHGPGNDDHSDGIIYKYPIPGYSEDSEHEIPDHLVFDQNTGWLYACNSQQNRIIRLNTATGTPGDDANPHESVDTYKFMENFIWEEYITDGLDAPTGIDINENRMIVSNYNSGDIHIYDITNAPILLGTISTQESGIMGIKIGPDGLIWFVNSITNKVQRVAMTGTSVQDITMQNSFFLYPNPAKNNVAIRTASSLPFDNMTIHILDITGKTIHTQKLSSSLMNVNVSSLSEGVYVAQLQSNKTVLSSQKLIIQK